MFLKCTVNLGCSLAAKVALGNITVTCRPSFSAGLEDRADCVVAGASARAKPWISNNRHTPQAMIFTTTPCLRTTGPEQRAANYVGRMRDHLVHPEYVPRARGVRPFADAEPRELAASAGALLEQAWRP